MTGRAHVAYYRVSTESQERSGLGLEAQQEAVRRFLGEEQGWLIAEIAETESGRNNSRPKFAEALRLCRVYRAPLAIARLDRLSRSAALIARLMDSGVDFVAADMPLANRFTIHILAAVAEYEAKLISERVREALAAAKARGVKLGGIRRPDFRTYLVGGNAASTLARQNRAIARALDLAPLISALRDDGRSLHGIAAELTRREIAPPCKGPKWYPATLRRMFELSGETLPVPRSTGRRLR